FSRDWSSDVCSSDLVQPLRLVLLRRGSDRPVHLRGGRVQQVAEGEAGWGREQGRHLRRRAGWGAALHVTGCYIAPHVEQGAGESVYHEGSTPWTTTPRASQAMWPKHQFACEDGGDSAGDGGATTRRGWRISSRPAPWRSPRRG